MADSELIIAGRSDGARLTLTRGSPGPHAKGRDLLALSARLDQGSELVASTGVQTFEGDGLPGWFRALADQWRGWSGELKWRSLEDDMFIAATHDGWGHVELRVTLRGPLGYLPDAWQASASMRLDAGEELTRIAADLQAFFADGDISPVDA